jgi:hypothetical protein
MNFALCPSAYPAFAIHLEIQGITEQDTLLRADKVSCLTLAQLNDHIRETFEIEGAISISLKNQDGDELWPPSDRPAFSSVIDGIHLPCCPELPPKFVVNVVRGEQPTPKVKCKIPIIDSDDFAFLYEHPWDLDLRAARQHETRALLHTISSFHHIPIRANLKVINRQGTDMDIYKLEPRVFLWFLFHRSFTVVCSNDAVIKEVRFRIAAIGAFLEAEEMQLARLDSFQTSVFPLFSDFEEALPGYDHVFAEVTSIFESVQQLHADLHAKVLQNLPIVYLCPFGEMLQELTKGISLYYPIYSAESQLEHLLVQVPVIDPEDSPDIVPFVSTLTRHPSELQPLLKDVLDQTAANHPDRRALEQSASQLSRCVAEIERIRAQLPPPPPKLRRPVGPGAPFTVEHFPVTVNGKAASLCVAAGLLTLTLTLTLEPTPEVAPDAPADEDDLELPPPPPAPPPPPPTEFALPESTVEPVGDADIRVKCGTCIELLTCESAEARERLLHAAREAHARSGGAPFALSWAQPLRGGGVPALEGHVIFVATGALWLYGGRRPDGRFERDFYRIDPDGPSAEPVVPAEPRPAPRLRFGHAVRDGRELWIYGGTPNGISALRDLWAFSLDGLAWSRFTRNPGAVWPPAAIGCALVALPDALLMFPSAEEPGRVYKFIFGEGCWVVVSATPPRMLHPFAFPLAGSDAVVLAGDAEVSVFWVTDGGMRIKRVKATGMAPFGRGVEGILCSAACVMVDNWVLAFGDVRGMRTYAIALSGRPQWLVIDAVAGEGIVQELSYYAVCADVDCLWIHGGRSPSGRMESALYRIERVQPESIEQPPETGECDMAEVPLDDTIPKPEVPEES